MTIFRVESSGSPLQARASNQSNVLSFAGIALVIILAFAIVKFILHKNKERKTSPEWLEKEKKRLTTKKDVDEAAEKLQLTKEEAAILWNICRNTKAPNIVYLSEDETAIDEIFKTEFNNMLSGGAKPEDITLIFRLRHKIEAAIYGGTKISSTTALSEGTKFTCNLESGEQISCTLSKTTKDALFLDIPQKLFDSPERPQELSKGTFTFTYPSITRYVFSARIVRYDTNTQGKHELVISHSNNLKIQALRSSRRLDYMKHTNFYAVVPSSDGDPAKATRKDKAYKCTLLNISGDGCCISSALPIKEGQFISIDVEVGGQTEPVLGKIVGTRRLDENIFALHIAFVKIETTFRNKIFALTYNYLESGDDI